MKYFSLMLLIFAISISLYTVEAYEVKNIIVIDPGHGGMDIGASRDGMNESDLVLDISFRIKEVLVNNGYSVILTRENKESLSDGKFIKRIDMQKRVEIINNPNVLLALSIHLNKFSIERYRGAQVFYSDANKNNIKLAKYVQNNLKQYLNTQREIVKRDNIFLLNKVSVPCCLIECGFLSNNEEFQLLKNIDYQYKIAKALMMGISCYLKYLNN